jgi:thioredoxin 1
MKEITQEQFDQEVRQATGLVLVDFYAADCAPCKQLVPNLEELERHAKRKVRVVQINAQEASDLAGEFRVCTVPALFLFLDGQCIGQRNGRQTARDLEEWIAETDS